MAGDPAIRVRGLTKVYGTVEALSDVDLDVNPGEVLGFIGPNGAGKTTALRIIMGFVRPTRGRASVLGLDPWHDAAQVHARVGYVPGDTVLPGRLTGEQEVRFAARLRRTDCVPVARRLAGRLELDLDRPARFLSKGNRQKLAVVLALMSEPALLILDEPTSGFDPLVQHQFHSLLREHVARGGSAILSSHVLGEVQQVADRVAALRGGRLTAVEDTAAMRSRSLHRVRAQFLDDVDVSEFAAIPGLRDAAVVSRTLTCSAPASALDPLVRALARYRLADLECTEADLEQAYLGFYSNGAP